MEEVIRGDFYYNGYTTVRLNIQIQKQAHVSAASGMDTAGGKAAEGL